MTNITLSIADEVYKRMKKHSEIKWSEFVRKMIEKRIVELEMLEKQKDKESIMTLLASEEVLKEEWENEADEKWNEI